jgi:uncharacterized protein YgiM (DUF1202 family)
MPRTLLRLALAGLILLLADVACNIPSASPTPNADATMLAVTYIAYETNNAATQTALPSNNTTTPVPTNTISLQVTSTANNPLVIRDALCWVGPGNAYEVVSAVKTGTQVQLVGRGSLSGWYIITNPIYHDPCWIETANLQIDPGYNISGLPIINPPPTPTPTLTNTHEPTTTPTATNTP